MRDGRVFAGLVILAGVLPGQQALAAAVKTHVAVHGGLSRLIIDCPQRMDFSQSQTGDVMALVLPGAGMVEAPRTLPTGVTGFAGAPGGASITLVHGATARIWRIDQRLIMDVHLPVAAVPPAGAKLEYSLVPEYAAAGKTGDRAKAGASEVRVKPVAAVPSSLASSLASSLPAAVQIGRARVKLEQEVQAALVAQKLVAAKQAAAQAAAAAANAEVAKSAQGADGDDDAAGKMSEIANGAAKALGAVRLDDDSLGGPAFFMPFTKEVGAAAFMRGGTAHLVFDTADPVDLSALRDDRMFGGARGASLPDADEIILPVPPDRTISLKRRSDGWVVVLAARNPGILPVMQRTQNGNLQLQVRGVGGTVVLSDQLTGGRLLVGTELADSSAVAAPRRMAEFSLLRTALGVVVAPVSDRILLTATKTGFSVVADRGAPLAMADSDDVSSLLPGAAMSRSFDLPDLPLVNLRKRYAMANLDTATAPQLARAAPRMQMAQTLLALGMGNEAAATLDLALSQEPGLAANSMQVGLHAIANFLADRPVRGAPFDQVALGATDEITLWRALTSADPADKLSMAALSQVWPLALTYPVGIRAKLLPLITERFAAAGDGQHLAAMLAAIDQLAVPPGNLAYAHGRAEELAGHLDQAAKLYRAAAAGRDRRYAAKAGRQLVAMDLARHKINGNEAAQRLDSLLYAWRGDQDELESRLVLAKLNSDRHAWRQGLSVLREAEVLYPVDAGRIHSTEHNVIAALAGGSNAQEVSPFDLVALLDDNADLLGADPNASQFAPVLLDKLMALDLPARAAPILRRMLGSASDPGLRSDMGARLAALTLDQGDGKTALGILDATESPAASANVIDQRLRVRANSLASTGDLVAALKILANVAHGDALDLRAELESRAHDWGAARDSLTQLVKQLVPEGGDIPQQAQEVVLRLAAATAELGDINGLQKLQELYGARLGNGAKAELFSLLTQKPVSNTADLPRAAVELGAAKDASADLAALSHP